MLNELSHYFEEQADKWNQFENRVDKSYDIKTKTLPDKNLVSVYKVGMMYDEEPVWNFVLGAEIKEKGISVYFFVDVEEEIIDSLLEAGHPYTTNLWMKEFEIKVDTVEEVKTLLKQHVWDFDPGYFY